MFNMEALQFELYVLQCKEVMNRFKSIYGPKTFVHNY